MDSAEQLAAFQRGASLLEVDCDIRFVDDFTAEVTVITGHRYSDMRGGSGRVAAKTIGDVILVNAPAVHALALEDLERLGCHEGGHVLLNKRGEKFTDLLHDLATSDWEANLLALAGSAMEEARIEREVVSRGFPPSIPALDMVHFGERLFEFGVASFECVTQDITPLEMARHATSAQGLIATTLAYIAGAQIGSGYWFNPAALTAEVAALWTDMLEPTWMDRIALYSSVPPVSQPMDLPSLSTALKAAADLEHETMRDAGFEFLGTDPWYFLNILPPARWNARVELLRNLDAYLDRVLLDESS